MLQIVRVWWFLIVGVGSIFFVLGNAHAHQATKVRKFVNYNTFN